MMLELQLCHQALGLQLIARELHILADFIFVVDDSVSASVSCG